MDESQFQTRFNAWLRAVWKRTGAFELKVTPDGSLPFSDVREHQEVSLLAAKTGVLVYKIPDDASGYKPFDAFALSGVASWIVIMFHCRDPGRRDFVMVPIQAWRKEANASERRSLTEDRAQEIGTPCRLGYPQ